MTELWSLLPESGWQRLAADFLWQSTLLGAVAVVLVRAFRTRPALRAAVALVAVALCLAVPLASLVVRTAGWGQLSAVAIEHEAATVAAASTRAASQTLTHARPADAPVAVRSPAQTPAHAADWAWPLLAAAWLCGSLALAWRLLRSLLAVRRLVRDAQPCREGDLCGELLRASRALGVLPPQLCTSLAVRSPALVVWGRPRIVLPAGAVARGDWYPVFCHELAHMARRDGAGRLLTELATIALPWQPLVWWLRREFRAACEEACDDWSVAAGADPVELAALLTEFIPQAQPSVVLAMSEGVATTRNRILRLLAMQGVPRARLSRTLGVGGWVVAAGLAIALALLQRGGSGGAGNELPPWGKEALAVAAARALPAAERPPRRPYRVEPPDMLLIDAVKVVPKPPYKIEALDVLHVVVLGTVPDQPIAGNFPVEADGVIILGPAYGSVKVSEMTLPEAREAIVDHLQNLLASPEVSVSLAESAGKQQISGEHLIGPDGTVNLGVYGSVAVAGMTVPEVRAAIEKHLAAYLEKPEVSVDVFAYNSLVYYVIIEGGESGDFVNRVMYTGGETVLDALSQLNHHASLGSCWVWISRPSADGAGQPQILPVDWQAIVERGETATNWQIQPGDRVFIREKKKGKTSAVNKTSPGRSVSQSPPKKRAASPVGVYEVLIGETEERAAATRLTCNANETVLDAVCRVGGAARLSEKAIWIERAVPRGDTAPQVLPVDWRAIVDSADVSTNWQIQPGDRVFIRDKKQGGC